MSNKKQVYQIKLLDSQTFKKYKEDNEEDFSTFEEYVNVILGELFDNNYLIETISHTGKEEIMIVYKISLEIKNRKQNGKQKMGKASDDYR